VYCTVLYCWCRVLVVQTELAVQRTVLYYTVSSVMQTDLCRLGDIKYDFVGHLETLEADLDVLLARLEVHTGRNTSAHRHVFPKGQNFHNMKTDKRLLKYYEPVSTLLCCSVLYLSTVLYVLYCTVLYCTV